MILSDIANWDVLIVDDEPDNLSLLEALLDFFDVRVTKAASGQQALDLLDRHRFNLALVDIQMPKISGYDVIKHIRTSQDPATRGLAAVAVTANAMDDDRKKCLDAGFDGYIAKPIEVTTFIPTVQAIIDAHQNISPTEPQLTAKAINHDQ